MFHAVIMLIATCFGCTLYYFFAFSGTNLLTRCHSASSLFSSVFRFRNPRQKISSESDEINFTINKRSRRSRSPETTWGEPPGAHTLGGRGPRWGRAQVGCGYVSFLRVNAASSASLSGRHRLTDSSAVYSLARAHSAGCSSAGGAVVAPPGPPGSHE